MTTLHSPTPDRQVGDPHAHETRLENPGEELERMLVEGAIDMDRVRSLLGQMPKRWQHLLPLFERVKRVSFLRGSSFPDDKEGYQGAVRDLLPALRALTLEEDERIRTLKEQQLRSEAGHAAKRAKNAVAEVNADAAGVRAMLTGLLRLANKKPAALDGSWRQTVAKLKKKPDQKGLAFQIEAILDVPKAEKEAARRNLRDLLTGLVGPLEDEHEDDEKDE